MTRIELITLHALELAELIGAQHRAGTLTIAADGEEIAEFDLEDVCLVVKLEEPIDDDDDDDDDDDETETLPFSRN